MLEGIYTEQIFQHPSLRPALPQPQETSGTTAGSEAIYRYSLRESDYPVLSLAEPISDNVGDVIMPGHYELALTDERDFLILMQSKNPVAIIPVIKVEEDASEKQRLNDKKYKKELKKEKKELAKTNEKRKKTGMSPEEEHIYKEASIEYNKDGGYYLIKYQCGIIKAWGAIKSK